MNPFEQLRRDDRPESPSPRFAALLRTRVEEALALGAPVPTLHLPERSLTVTAAETNAEPNTEPAPGATAAPPVAAITPYLCVADAAAALDWYAMAFEAVETVRYAGDDGRIGHAEMLIGGATLMLSDPYPEMAVVPPDPSGSSVALHVNLPDVDAVYARAVAGGATGLREPEDQPYGERSSAVIDPFGHRWMIQTTIAEPSVDEINQNLEGFTVVETPVAAPVATPPVTPVEADRPIELGYLTIGFDDTAKARAFYGSLFGWRTETGNMGDPYAHIDNTELPMGMTPEGVDSAPVLYFRVPDTSVFAAKVIELGGSVVSESDYESGGDVVCRDDQGREFHLWQPAPGY